MSLAYAPEMVFSGITAMSFCSVSGSCNCCGTTGLREGMLQSGSDL